MKKVVTGFKWKMMVVKSVTAKVVVITTVVELKVLMKMMLEVIVR